MIHFGGGHVSGLSKYDFFILWVQVSGLRFRVSGLKSQVSGLRSQVSGLGSQVSGLRSQVSGLKVFIGGPALAGLNSSIHILGRRI